MCFVTKSSTLNYCANVVFLFYSFLVLTVCLFRMKRTFSIFCPNMFTSKLLIANQRKKECTILIKLVHCKETYQLLISMLPTTTKLKKKLILIISWADDQLRTKIKNFFLNVIMNKSSSEEKAGGGLKTFGEIFFMVKITPLTCQTFRGLFIFWIIFLLNETTKHFFPDYSILIEDDSSSIKKVGNDSYWVISIFFLFFYNILADFKMN